MQTLLHGADVFPHRQQRKVNCDGFAKIRPPIHDDVFVVFDQSKRACNQQLTTDQTDDAERQLYGNGQFLEQVLHDPEFSVVETRCGRIIHHG